MFLVTHDSGLSDRIALQQSANRFWTVNDPMNPGMRYTVQNLTGYSTEDIWNRISIMFYNEYDNCINHMMYVLMVSDVIMIDDLKDFGVPKRNCVYYPPSTNIPHEYLKLSLTMWNIAPFERFRIGTHDTSTTNNAGVLPILYHDSKLYMILGLDSRLNRYSDFGGSFDKQYSLHRGQDSYKNTILKKYQIVDGKIDDSILIDHFMNLSRKDRMELLRNFNQMGKGDINTCYTAFREFMEEHTSRVSNYTESLFDLQLVYEKLFVKKQYVFLGGDPVYAYDTYVVFFTIDDIHQSNRYRILNQIKSIERSNEAYMRELSTPFVRNQETVAPTTIRGGMRGGAQTRTSQVPLGMPMQPPVPPKDKVVVKITCHAMPNTNGMPDISIYNRFRAKQVPCPDTSKRSSMCPSATSGAIPNVNPETSCIASEPQYRYRDDNYGYTVRGNSEMRRIDLFPMKDMIEPMIGVEYVRYSYCSPKNRYRYRGRNRNGGNGVNNNKTYHADKYSAPVYDQLRSTFADALVRYNKNFLRIMQNFEAIKSTLI